MLNNVLTTDCGRHPCRRAWPGLLALVMWLAAGPVLAQAVVTAEMTGPSSYTPGATVTDGWTLVVGNTGDAAATPALSTNFPPGSTISWSCAASGTGSACDDDQGTGNLSGTNGSVGAGGTVTYTFDSVTLPASLTADPLQVTGSAGAASDSASSDRAPQVDVTISKSNSGQAHYVPGATGTWTVVIGNDAGPSDAIGVQVSDELPAGVASRSWSCSATSGSRCGDGTTSDSGIGALAETVDVAAGGSVTFTITDTFEADATQASITNTASYILPGGHDNGTNPTSDSASKTRQARTDLSVQAPGDGSYTPGVSGNTIVFTIANAGPSHSIPVGSGAAPAKVEVTLPGVGSGIASPVVMVDWACADLSNGMACPDGASGTSDPEATTFEVPVTLTAGGSGTIVLTVDYPSELAVASLAYSARIVTTDTDPEGDNDSDPVDYTLAPQADLEIAKTASQAILNPGTAFRYDLLVSNHGPSDVSALVSDTLDPILKRAPRCDTIGAPNAAAQRPCWEYCPLSGQTPDTCTADGNPVETVVGSGDLGALSVPVPADGSILIRIYAAVGQTAGGTITNTATVALPPGVTHPGGPDAPNSSSVDVDIEVSTDVAVAKTSVGAAVPGQPHTYKVTVSNDGFIPAQDVRVSDVLPLYAGAGTAGFEPGTIFWQCSAANGACCNTNSSLCGTLNPTPPVSADALLSHGIDLPPDSQVEFTFVGDLDARSTGTLSNTASAVLTGGVIDSNPGNNSATATIAVSGQTALAIDKRLDGPLEENGDGTFRLHYVIDVSNGGPSRAEGVVVADDIDANVFQDAAATWTCEVVADPGNTVCSDSGGTGDIATTVDLDVGGMVRLRLDVDTVAGQTSPVQNRASASLGTDVVEDVVTTGLRGRAELRITKDSSADPATPGKEVTYFITVENDGPDDAFDARVVDEFVRELEDVSWTCGATTPIPGDLAYTGIDAGALQASGGALALSADGRHAYQVSAAVDADDADVLIVYDRNNVPGFGFGSVAVIETETNGVNDNTDGGAEVEGMEIPRKVAISADGSRVYVLAVGGIAVFERDTNPASPGFGRLSFAGAHVNDEPADPRDMALGVDALFVASATGLAIHPLDPQNGLPGEPELFEDGAGWNPRHLVLVPQHQRLFVASDTAPYLRDYLVGQDGALTPLGAGISDPAYAGPSGLLASPEGTDVYLSSQATGRINQARLDAVTLELGAAGSVTSNDFATMPGYPAADPLAAAHGLAIAPDGEHLLVASSAGNVLLQYRRIPQQGTLIAEALLVRDVEGIQPAGVGDALAITSDGRHVLVASASDAGEPLEILARRAPDPLFALVEVDRRGDPLEQGGPLPGLLAPADVASSDDGQFVYVVSPADDSLTVFRRNPDAGGTDDTAGGHLTFVASYRDGVDGMVGLDGAHRVVVGPGSAPNPRVYVTSEQANSLAVFDRDTATGLLSNPRMVADGGAHPALLGATGIAVDSTNTRVYVAAPFDDAIAVYKVDAGALTFLQEVRGGIGGVTGMDGVTDLALSADGTQLLAVSAFSNTVVVFDVDARATGDDYGRLEFVQSRLVGALLPNAISLPADPTDPHVYIAAGNSDEVVVMRRVLDPSNPEFGGVVPLFEYLNGSGGITAMDEPWDLELSPDGRRLYVAARSSNSVLIFDRDLNRGSASYGGLVLVEVRTDGVDGVDGIRRTYAVAVSNDSRNVYVAGFDDSAVASFAIGSGSSCSAGGSGALDDVVTIGASGTLAYVVKARVRPDATGEVCNTATVYLPENFAAEFDDPGNNQDTECDALVTSGDLSVSKTNDQVSVVAGETVTYEVVVRNPGPSHLVHGPGTPVTLTDALPAAAGFVPESATWTCTASSSGMLDFVAAIEAGDPLPDSLAGVSGLALMADSDGAGPLGAYLATASVLDNAITLFRRDPLDGGLLLESTLRHAAGASHLAGARALAASVDGRFLYVASRVSDAVTVLRLDPDPQDASRGVLVQVQVHTGLLGLDQAVDLLLTDDQRFVHVAGANDDAIAVFSRDPVTGMLAYIESEAEGQDDPLDDGGTVSGLASVQSMVASPDGLHLYALSGSSGSIAWFTREFDAGSGLATGALSFAGVLRSQQLPVGASLNGAADAVFDASGEYLYVAAADVDAVLVLQRDAGTGALSLSSRVAHGVDGSLGLLGPRGLLLTADGNHLYVSAQAGNSVAWYLRDPVDGSLRYLGQRSSESAGVSGLDGVTAMALDEDLGQFYAAGTLANAVVHMERQADSFCPPSGTGPLLEVPFDIAAGGTVTFLITVDVATTLAGPLVNTVSVDAGAADGNPDNDTATDTDVFGAVADLAITKDDGLAEYDGLAGARAVVGDASHLFVAGAGDNAIGIFERVADASAPGGEVLRFASVVRGGEQGAQGLAGVADLLLGNDGAHVYAASPVDNSVATYSRGTDGTLAFAGMVQNGVFGASGLSGATALAASPDGRHVYVAGTFSNAIAVLSRDANPASPDHGALAFQQMLQNGVGGVSGLGEPVALAVSPDGKHVYALGAEAGTLAVFLRNDNAGSSGFGNLQYVEHYTDGEDAVTGLAGARSLVLHPGGTRVYALGAELGSLAFFSRDAGTGTLLFDGDLRDGDSGVEGLTGAARLRTSADGDSLYVAAALDGALLRFDLDANGTPSFAGRIAAGDPAPVTGGNVLGLAGASDLFVASDGQHAFSVAADEAALAAFGRDTSGALSFHEALFDGLGGIAPGDAVRYVIRVDNHGPSDVADARVVDAFPDSFDVVQWSCISELGAQCVSGTQTGNIDVSVFLPVGSNVVFEAIATVSDSATGRLVNTATVAALPSGEVTAVDPNPSNNSATDDDTVLSPASNLVVSVDDGSATAVPGGEVSYDVTIANLGPSYAEGVRLSDVVPPALRDVEWTCAPSPLAGVLTPIANPAQPLDGYRALRVATLGQHAYAVGSDGGGVATLVLFQRNPLSGVLAEKESYEDGDDATAITGASDLVLSRDQRFVFVAGSDADAIAVFARDVDSGSLSYLRHYQDGDLGIDGLGGVAALALSPDGTLLYAASPLDSAIMAFAVDTGSGTLAPVDLVSQAQPGMDGLAGVHALAVSEDGSHLFAIAGTNQALSAWRRETDGSLTQVALVQDFQLPGDTLLDPAALLVAGPYIVVADAGSNSVSRFIFDPQAPGLTREWTLADGDGISGLVAPRALAFDPDQARLYVAAQDSVHLLDLQGSTPEPLASYDAGAIAGLAGVSGLLLAPNQKVLYSLAEGPAGVVGVFARERGSRCGRSGLRGLDGELADIAPGGQVAFQVHGRIHANAAGTLVYGVGAMPRGLDEELDPSDNSDQDINSLVPAPDLAVVKSDGLAEVVAGTALSWHIDLANAGVSDALGAVLDDPAPVFPDATAGLLAGSGAWSCAANLPLEPGAVTARAELAGVAGIAVAPDGTRLYAVNPGADALLSFPRQPNGNLGNPTVIVDGQLLGGQTVFGLDGASSVAVTPDGRQVLVTGAHANSLVVFTVGATGALTPQQVLTSSVGPVVGLFGPVHVVVSADGTGVFVASPGSDAITVFRREPATGALAFVERVRDGNGTILPDSNVLLGVHRLRLSPDGSHLYALATTSEAVSSFAIHPQTGRLDYLGRVRSDGPGGAALDGALDFAGSGDSAYALGNGAITLLLPGADGVLATTAVYDGIPELADPLALALDPSGSRLYLADAAGAIHVFARDWNDGSLDLRHRYQDPLLPVAATAMRSTTGADLYLVQPDPGQLQRLDEQALSRCLQAAGSGEALQVPLDVGVGGFADVVFDATVHPSARGTLLNTASFTPTDGADPSPSDASASDSTLIRVVSDLSLGKSGPATAVAGEVVEYRIVVSNAGPSSALGMRVVDVLPGGLESATWTCTASTGSSCAPSGSGDVDASADLLPGGSLEVVLSARVAPAFRGLLGNTASLVMEAGATDPTPGDHDATVGTEVSGEVSLTLTKDNGTDTVVAGMPTSYTIRVANAGPSDALSVEVTDLLPALLADATWSCSPVGTGSACPVSGQGNLQAIASVGAGGSVDFTLTATLDAAAEGVLENSASVVILDDTLEREPGDEMDSDSDAIVQQTGLSLQLSAPVNPYDPASVVALPITATVANSGPSLARQATLDITFSAPVTGTLPGGCSLQGGTTATCTIAGIAPGSATVLSFALRQLPAAPGSFTASGQVTARDTDPDSGDDSDSVSVDLATGGDVAVAIDNGLEQLVPGRAVTYTIDVRNLGSVTLEGIAVDVTPAVELLAASWTCTGAAGATCTASGSGPIADTLQLASGQSVRYLLNAVVDPALDADIPRLVAQSASATAAPGADINTANNIAVDEDMVFYIIFEDGFEEPLLRATPGSDRLDARECAWLRIPPEQCPANQKVGQQ